MISLFKVAMNSNTPKAVGDVLMSGYIGEGEKVEEFTSRCKKLIGCKHAVATNSGTSALQLALFCAGVGHGDVVISTPVTCLATNTAIRAVGADILWADVDPRTGSIDPESVKDLLERSPDTVGAIMCVHWGGMPCNMKRLLEIADDYGVTLIEDAAQAWLSRYDEKNIGSFGHLTCFSFQAIKHLTTGDGGLVTMSSNKLYETARLAKWFGLDRKLSTSMRCDQDPPMAGFKYQMNDIAAAIGLCNIDESVGRVELHQAHARRYDQEFAHLQHVAIPFYSSVKESSYWLYTILVENQEAFIAFMKDRGVECSKVHARNDTKTVFKQYKAPLPGVASFDEYQVNIPVGWWLSGDEISHIINCIRSFDDGYSNCSKEQDACVSQSNQHLAAACWREQR